MNIVLYLTNRMKQFGWSQLKPVTIIFLILVSSFANAANISSTTTGGFWDLPSTWVGGVVPTIIDDVTIVSGSTVVIRNPYSPNTPAPCNSVTILGTLTLGATNSINERGLSVSASILIEPGGVLTNNGTATAAHQINVGGDFINNGTFNSLVSNTATQVTFNGSGAQSFSGTSATQNFQGFIVNKPSGQLTVVGNISEINVTNFQQISGDFVAPSKLSASGSFTITTGTFTGGSELSILGNFLNSSGNFSAGNQMVLSGNFTNNSTFNAGTGTMRFNGSSQNLSGSALTTFNHVIVSSSTALILDITGGTTINGNLSINDGATFDIRRLITVNGITTVGNGVSGNLIISSTSGRKTFAGQVIISSGGTWNNTANENAYFRSGIVNNGNFTAGTGIQTFEVNSQTIEGTYSIPNVEVTSGVTLTNNGTLTVSTALSGAGGLEQGINSILNIGGTSGIVTLSANGTNNTVNYIGSAQTLKSINYVNLGLSGNDAKALRTGTTIISGNLTLSGTTSTTTAVGIIIEGNLTIGDGCTFTDAGFDLTINGSTSVGNGISGNLTIGSISGRKQFSGPVVISSGATWDNSINENIYFRGGVTNNGTFLAGTGTYFFEVNSQSITGTFSMSTVEVASGVTLTNNGTLSTAVALAGTGSIVQGANSILNIGGLSNITTMIADADNNTVNYVGGAQTIKAINFVNLGLSGSDVKTLRTATTSISGNLTLSGTTSTTTQENLTVGGNLLIGDGTTFTVAAFDLTVNGNTTIGNGSSGSIIFSSTTGIKTFKGLVTVSAGATWDNSSRNEEITFQGGITNNGTFTAGTGIQNFQTNTQTLTGSINIARMVVSSVSLTNTNTLTISTALSGTGTLVQSANSVLNINGTSTLTNINASASGNTVNYNGPSPSIIAGSYQNLILNQSSGEATLSGNTTISGILTLNAGNFNIETNTLTLGAEATISIAAPSASAMIVTSGGEVRKVFTTPGSFTFPIGEKTNVTEYSPISVNVVSASNFTSAYIGASVANAKHPSNASGTDFLTRYWNITQSGISDCQAIINGSYLPADISGTEGNIYGGQLNGTFNQITNGWKKFSALNGNLLTTATNLPDGQTAVFTGIKGSSPSVNILGGDVTVCLNTPVALNASVSGDPTIIYAWSPSTGLSASDVINPVATPGSTTTYTLTIYDGNGISASDVTTITTQQPTITVNNAAICVGSTATLTASGATSYTWSPATGLSSTSGASVTANPTTTTTYTVTGTDGNSCSNTATATVTVNPLPVVAVNNQTMCSGSSATLTASGATSYTWSPATGLSSTSGASVTANPTTTTTYTVTGTDGNSCSTTATATVIVNASPVITVNNEIICSGASATLTASGATSYTWSPATGLSSTSGASVTANPTTTTTYTVTGIDGTSCSSTATATVTVNSLPIVTVNNEAICSGSSATLTASGATSYAWSPATGLSASTGASVSANPSSTTTYTITGTDDNACTNATTATVTVNPRPSTPIISGSNLETATPMLTSNIPAGNQWFKDGIAIAGATNQTLTVSSNGSYTVVVTANGCIGPASDVFVVLITGLEDELISGGGLIIYPNPTNETLYLDLAGFSSDSEIEVRIYDLTGRLIINKTMTNAENSLDVRGLSDGYHLLYTRQNNKSQVERFLKK